ncbi:phage baseplate assembly protein V [Schinkia azotoformans]|uniref:phage baseplate assembly protein V n=1 Tax=Schinkia azotoformans TaxID=1454 RepID=UPI002DB9F416|nr:phage baseplate assembly protein V [Schinkia azotoformans]MEC1744112.1 phage baseplate assembly protein V [Schinkia azotoformans]
MDPLLKNMIQIGIVSSVNPEKCAVKVAFNSRDDSVSPELPVLVRGSLGTKDYWLPTVGEQVVCISLPNGNARGFVLGSFYSNVDKPSVTEEGKRQIAFEDGTTIAYDQKTHELYIEVIEKITIKAPKGITLIADDPIGTGVSIVGKNTTGSW